MRSITIIGILHLETINPNINSDAVYQIIKRIDPDALMVECAIDQFDRWKSRILDRKNTEAIEARVFTRYLSEKSIPLLPFDMAGKPEIFDRSYFDTVRKIEEDIVTLRFSEKYKNNEYLKSYFDYCEADEENVKNISLRVLNSVLNGACIEYWFDLSYKYIDPIVSEAFPTYSEFIKKFAYLEQKREQDMAKNIVVQSKPFEKSVVIVGGAHKPGIMKNMKMIDDDFFIKEYWEYFEE